MTTIKHPDTYECDLCGRDMGEKSQKVKTPVMFTTEQNEGKPCKPYLQKGIELDMCDECLDRAVRIQASGCMGINSYGWRGDGE